MDRQELTRQNDPPLVRPSGAPRQGGGEDGGGNANANAGPANPEELGLGNRCVARGLPRLSGPYNNLQIVQSPGFVVLTYEVAHDPRIIPLDGRPHLPPTMRQWMGDSRDHWEGDTLVIDTTNFTAKTSFQGSGENLHFDDGGDRAGVSHARAHAGAAHRARDGQDSRRAYYGDRRLFKTSRTLWARRSGAKGFCKNGTLPASRPFRTIAWSV